MLPVVARSLLYSNFLEYDKTNKIQYGVKQENDINLAVEQLTAKDWRQSLKQWGRC